MFVGVGRAREGNGRLTELTNCVRAESGADIGWLRAHGKPLPFVVIRIRRPQCSSARTPVLVNARSSASTIITRHGRRPASEIVNITRPPACPPIRVADIVPNAFDNVRRP